jgi:replicative DNA helicase
MILFHSIRLPTGYHDFDDMTSGLQPSDSWSLGRPSMGKPRCDEYRRAWWSK